MYNSNIFVSRPQFIFNNNRNRESNYRYEFEDFDYKLTKNKIG